MKFICKLCHTADHPRSRAKRDLCEVCCDGLAPRDLAWCSYSKHRVVVETMLRSGKMCRPCNAARLRAAYAANRAARRAYRQAYRAAHLAQEQARERAYRARNKAAISAQKRAYRRTHRAVLQERWRRYYQANAARLRAATAAWHAANRGYMRQWHARHKLRILQSWRRAA